MKSIKEAESEFYKNNVIESSMGNYKSNFVEGVEFAQLWVPVEEELPEHRSVVLGKIANLNYPHLFCYDEINSEWYHLDGFEFIGSDLIPTHWRPIERK